jgi:hypothetical protein
MRSAILTALALFVGALTAGVLMSKHLATRHAAELAGREQAWEAERATFEDALSRMRQEALIVPAPVPALLPVTNGMPAQVSSAEIIVRLIELSSAANAQTRVGQREIVYWLEELAFRGPSALPAIQEFLQRYEDVELDTSAVSGKGTGTRLPGEFLFPPSLRFGLFDVVQRIGGEKAEVILTEALNQTGRGLEVAYLTRVLQELAPDRHRAAALKVAHRLLSQPGPESSSRLDRNHRDHLYAVLLFYQDTSYAAVAQTRVLGADGQPDQGAIRYLQRSLGAQAVPLAAQTYHDPRLTNSAAREPFARLALTFAGADPRATEFYAETINDPALTPNHRRNLIEDLNQDGFADPKNLTANDLPLIENRIELIEKLAPSALDDANAAAFQEAYKDLLLMQSKITGQPPGQP